MAQGAKLIAKLEGASPEVCEQTFVGGILEDVGILVLAANFPEAYDRIVANVLDEHILITTAELWEFGVTHAEVGTYLLGLWGLPAPILNCVGMHHRPHLVKDAGFAPELAIYAADVLVGDRGGHPFFRTGRFDEAAFAQLGLLDKVETWRRALHEADEVTPGEPEA